MQLFSSIWGVHLDVALHCISDSIYDIAWTDTGSGWKPAYQKVGDRLAPLYILMVTYIQIIIDHSLCELGELNIYVF